MGYNFRRKWARKTYDERKWTAPVELRSPFVVFDVFRSNKKRILDNNALAGDVNVMIYKVYGDTMTVEPDIIPTVVRAPITT